MSAHPSIETLRELVTRDQAFFKAQSQRLSEIQQSDPNTLSDADKNSLSNWDKSVVTDCNRQLLLLEEIEQPSADERAIMRELHNLITLGDHIMEKRNLVRAELNDRLNAVKKSKAGKSVPENTKKTEPVATTPHVHFADTGKASNTVTITPSEPAPEAVASTSGHTHSPHVPADINPNDVALAATHDSKDTEAIDPKVLYNILKVEPDASLVDIKKAAKKATLRLHPDRNQDDPKAAGRFADFQAACQVFESEEMRQEFNDTGDVKEIEDLQARLAGLAVK